MTVILYTPNEPPQGLSPDGFLLPNLSGFAHVTARVAEELNCSLGLVDVLDTGPGYVAYSIFDCEDEPNDTAMQALTAISRHPYDPENEDDQLRGRILVVTEK